MVQTIEKLKSIIQDGMKIMKKNGKEIIINRFPNNIIKIDNKSISWIDLQDLLAGSEYKLVLKEKHMEIFFDDSPVWGGRRLPGPGKKIGRPGVLDKKIPVTFSIKESVKRKLDVLIYQTKKDKNQIIEEIILLTCQRMGF